MNSDWQINRVGLIDFWYYDEEEFYFLDGRMLLRGANGSGKSVTMQSFIPLLLDGNMRPERLDPFGSRARKMENYLLEEDDDREERIGYLYMEFKRLESDAYLTVGIGMRARKSKKLETWYFCITDGRRIGEDFFLYKDVRNKIAYTKQELRNRIGEGGKLMETQGEYAQCINRLLFGFETMEEYKEMIELLIQLRTPKLSKDFKPSVINDILSSSLQTLSEDDLRPMSEAIENMDGLKTNLDSLKDSLRAARQIERIYDQYNQIVLYDKALLFSREADSYRQEEKQEKEIEERLRICREKIAGQKQRYEELSREEAVLSEEKRQLDESDATKIKEKELVLARELAEQKEMLADKSRQQEDKKERRLDTEQKIKKQKEQNELIWDEIEESLQEMEQEMEDIPFDEFDFLKNELCAAKEEPYNFQAHARLFQVYKKQVEDGRAALLEEEQCRRRYDDRLQEMDGKRKLRDSAERELHARENQLHEIKSELTEQLYRWERDNEELKAAPEVLQEAVRLVERYRLGEDYSEIAERFRGSFYEKDDMLRDLLAERQRGQQELDAQIGELKEERRQWEEKKDPEPEQPTEVMNSRKALEEKGIPYLQFYKVVDFEASLGEKAASSLEEALWRMGLLDALIVPAEYRKQVRQLGEGLCDHYIFSDVAHVKKSLMEALDIYNGENDILLYQNISNILRAVAYGGEEEQGAAWIGQDGSFRLGVLEGTVTKQYEARYIGAKSREKYRAQKIEELSERIAELEAQRMEAEEDIRVLTARRERLFAEWQELPSGEDLKLAARECAEQEHVLEMVCKEIAALEEALEESRRELESVRLKVQNICAKTCLTVRKDVFEEALVHLQSYGESLTQLQISHSGYINGAANLRAFEERLSEIDEDLDGIMHDCIRTEAKCRETEGMLESVREQLSLTNYEEIKERLDHCMKRLSEIPKEREESVLRQATLSSGQERLEGDRLKNQEALVRLADRRRRLEQAFAAEYKLGYVAGALAATEDMEDMAKKVCQMLAGSFGNKKQSDLFGNVQASYHENRGYLLEYNLTLQTLFDELDEDTSFLEMSMRRIDITAKYRGLSVSFKELLGKLEQDIGEQTRLLSDKDRELFEDILANTISKKIRGKIQASRRWVEKMNQLMESMQTSSGLSLSLRWKSRRAESEEQLDTKALVELLQKDVEIMRAEEVERMARHFRSKIEEARKLTDDVSSGQSFHMVMREVLDYRKWFEFQLECQKTGEKRKELTDRVFFTFSGGEKAMAMYVPLFSAVVAKYAGARPDAPRLISLDEAFAGVDEMNIKDMFRLMVEFHFNFMINSQILWGDYETVPAIAIYQLVRPENAKYVTVIPYVWNGHVRSLAEKAGDEVASA